MIKTIIPIMLIGVPIVDILAWAFFGYSGWWKPIDFNSFNDFFRFMAIMAFHLGSIGLGTAIAQEALEK